MRYSLFAVYPNCAERIFKSDSLDVLQNDNSFTRGSKVIYDHELKTALAKRGRLWVEVAINDFIEELVS